MTDNARLKRVRRRAARKMRGICANRRYGGWHVVDLWNNILESSEYGLSLEELEERFPAVE